MIPQAQAGDEVCEYSEEEVEEMFQVWISKQLNMERKEASRRLWHTIIDLGGINDPDYESIPYFLIRKGGRTLDDMTEELTREGYPCESANDVYDLVTQAW